MRCRAIIYVGLLICLSACSKKSQSSCTDDCRERSYNPGLAQKLSQQTGLPICQSASVLETRNNTANNHEDYDAQVDVESYCPSDIVRSWEAAATTEGRSNFISHHGYHVTLHAIPIGYALTVWKPAT
jgi:hypothetical protein